MRDQSDQVTGGLTGGSSMSCGNTQAAPESYALAHTARGSAGINAQSPNTDVLVTVTDAPSQARTVIVGAAGGKTSTPAESGASLPGRDEGGWTLTRNA